MSPRVTKRTAHGSALNEKLPPHVEDHPDVAAASAVIALLDPPEHVPNEQDEELSELEVQHLLEQRDKEPLPILPAEYLEAAMKPVGAGIPDSLPCPACAGSGRVPASAVVAVPPTAPHALDSAEVNAKIVVVLLDGKSHAVLAGPDGAKELPKGDPAHRLPEGARIRKLGPKEFLAEQMSPAEDFPPLVTETAGEAIAGFIPHFHPHGLS